MPAFFEITFLPEGRVEEFASSRGNYYELDDGSRLDVETEPIWCHQCGKITEGERIETLAEIDKTIADLQDPKSELFKFASPPPQVKCKQNCDEFRLRQIDRLLMRRKWRESRLSSPKCIECGSTQITQLPWEQSVLIPPGTFSITVRCVAMCSTGYNEWLFTPEGDRIHVGTGEMLNRNGEKQSVLDEEEKKARIRLSEKYWNEMLEDL